MPKFAEDTTLEQFHVGSFGFTAQTIEELESSGYTLADIVVDKSGSTQGFTAEMETALKGAIISLKGDPAKGIKPHPKADSIMVRVTTFSTRVDEVFGYTLLSNVNPDVLTGCLKSESSTCLFDACVSGSDAAYAYAKALRGEDYDVNGILIVITDGLNNDGKLSAGRDSVGGYYPSKQIYDSQVAAVQTSLKATLRKEAMESYVSILIGVNVGSCKTVLDEFHANAGFTQSMIALADASPETIAKIGQFVSQSVSSQSQARGTGGPSQAISSTI